jgi:hypothetical protein
MASTPKYVSTDANFTLDVHACLLSASGVPECVSVSIGSERDAVFFDRRINTHVYRCYVDRAPVEVPENWLGTKEEVQAMVSSIDGSHASGLAAQLLTVMPRKPKALSQPSATGNSLLASAAVPENPAAAAVGTASTAERRVRQHQVGLL